MKKTLLKRLLPVTSLIGLVTLAITIGMSDIPFVISTRSSSLYEISFSNTENKLQPAVSPTTYLSGEKEISTRQGNDITFEYTSLTTLANTWQIIRAGGSFTNVDAFSGLESVSFNFLSDTAQVKVYYSYDRTFSEDRSLTISSSESRSATFDFDNYQPNFFKVDAITNSNIASMILTYKCSDFYPTLDVTSNNDLFGTVTGSGVYKIGQSVSISAAPTSDYYFNGWYDGETLISMDNPYVFNMLMSDTSYQAKFTHKPEVLLSIENELYGTLTGDGLYNPGDVVNIEANLSTSVTFDGWYDGETLVSTNNPYSFTMGSTSVSLEARGTPDTHNVSVAHNSTQGTISGDGSYGVFDSVTLTATPVDGYGLTGWYDGETLVSSENPYTFTMPANDVDLTARFEILYFSVDLTVNNNLGGSVTGEGSFTYNQEVTLTATVNLNYHFLGWYSNDQLVSSSNPYIFDMPLNDLNYQARFKGDEYSVSVYHFDETNPNGTVTGAGTYSYNDSVSLVATPDENMYLHGYYDESLNVISISKTYTFTMPAEDVDLYVFMDASRPDHPPQKGSTYEFGSYPQTVVSDSSTITALNGISSTNTKGYIEYNGEEYKKISANPYDNDCEFSNGSIIQENQTYYFQVEPIVWDVLDTGNGSSFLLTQDILEAKRYDDSSNNYMNSEIRAWLNSDFYNTSFTETEKANILTTTVDNSVASTGYLSNPYVCPDTNDNVFLLSRAELTTSNYGFDSNSFNHDLARRKQTTDYARATGAYTYWNETPEYHGNGHYWTRSPSFTYSHYAQGVSFEGRVFSDSNTLVNYGHRTPTGVSPALKINL